MLFSENKKNKESFISLCYSLLDFDVVIVEFVGIVGIAAFVDFVDIYYSYLRNYYNLLFYSFLLFRDGFLLRIL